MDRDRCDNQEHSMTMKLFPVDTIVKNGQNKTGEWCEAGNIVDSLPGHQGY